MKKLLLIVIVMLSQVLSFGKDRKYFILFKPGEFKISKTAGQYLDSLIYQENIRPGININIIGYADYVGDSSSNMVLSQKRAEYVKEYLVSLGIKESNIETVQWKGELPADDSIPNKGIPKDRRVDIIIKEAKKQIPIAATGKYKVNDIIRLNILFKEASHQYLQKSLFTLDSFYRILVTNKNLKISIEGHICCGSSPTDDGYDMDTQKIGLSVNRAKAVYDFLVQKGIDPKRMSYKGFGFSRPLYPLERTQEERDLNKRVEIRIVEQ